ncbi:hypothetical protein EWM64_g9603 [Hericium alpestre]|uniref:Uncharacterized protein n=1 Tax=Hericium alpestre TaxID=135208 RepID=A0A4Y9ZLV6_9AGAM|nr:hypothetical protein EWM64_g9603 [Hericium alpestre]
MLLYLTEDRQPRLHAFISVVSYLLVPSCPSLRHSVALLLCLCHSSGSPALLDEIMATFDPPIVRALIRNTLPSDKHRAVFDEDWESAVVSKKKAWRKHRKESTYNEDQLEWEANVIKYVDYVNRLTAAMEEKPASFLPDRLPLYGLTFLPPTYCDLLKRQKDAVMMPNTTYLQPLNVVHPFYFTNLGMCPACDSTEIT